MVHAMIVITNPTTAEQFDARAARVSLAPGGGSPGPLDGAWWPRSRDLTRELPPLAAAFEERWGRITRTAVNPAFWPVIPRKVQVTGHVVRVGWFTVQDPHALLLLSRTAGRWDLLVIPPRTSPATAARLMAAACDPRNVLTAGDLMAGAADRDAAAADRAQQASWEGEGGPGRPRRRPQRGRDRAA
jgi:hypothetical protein